MKAQVIERFGGPEVFSLVDVPTPTPAAGQVLIKVAATCVNPLDCKIRSGALPALVPAFPAILHSDVAGTVVEAAPDVTAFKAGDEVYTCVRERFGSQGNC